LPVYDDSDEEEVEKVDWSNYFVKDLGDDDHVGPSYDDEDDGSSSDHSYDPSDNPFQTFQLNHAQSEGTLRSIESSPSNQLKRSATTPDIWQSYHRDPVLIF